MGDIGDHVAKLLNETRVSTYLGRALDAGHRPSFSREPATEYLYALTAALEQVCIALAEEVDGLRADVDRLEGRHFNAFE